MSFLLKTCCATAVLGLAAAVPAQAQTLAIPDGRDTEAVQELLSVRVVHESAVTVVMKFSSNYHRDGEYPFGIYYDTDRGDPGPEYLYDGHFGGVYERESWAGGTGDEMDCNITGALNGKRHTIRITVGHRCLGGDKGPVRVNVHASGQADDLSFVPDYAPGERQFSDPVARG